MNRTLRSLLLLGLPVSLSAQPVLNFPGAAPQPGEQFAVKFGAYQPPGNSGSGLLWDFGDLNPDSTGTITVSAPGALPGGNAFPSATAGVAAPDGTRFYLANGSGLNLLGNEFFGQSAPFTNPAQTLVYPCTYQTSWQDTYAGAISIGGLPIQLQGTINAEADGYGTLALPEGMANNVLRVRTVDVLSIVTLLGNFTITTTTHAFYAPDISLPVLTISRAEGDLLGEPFLLETLQWIDLSVVGIAEGSDPPVLGVFPNPTQGVVTVVLPGGHLAGGTIEVFDTAGRMVMHISNPTSSGSDRLLLSMDALAPGVYSLRATGRNAAVATARVLLGR